MATKLTNNASDKQKDAMETTAQLMQNISVSTVPVVICAVQRKVNIGNFETIDVYHAVALPQPQLENITDANVLAEALKDISELGFSITSRETNIRYKAIKSEVEKKRN